MDKVVKIMKEDDLEESDDVYTQALIICKDTLDRRNFLTMETKEGRMKFSKDLLGGQEIQIEVNVIPRSVPTAVVYVVLFSKTCMLSSLVWPMFVWFVLFVVMFPGQCLFKLHRCNVACGLNFVCCFFLLNPNKLCVLI